MPVSRDPRRRWYAAGLRFTCQPECGACCTNHDKYTYIYLEDEDCRRLRDHLGISPPEFLERYTELDDGLRVLSMREPDCPFLDGWRCTVYEARPLQCRTFPFWRENLASRRSWKRLRRFCPGIDRGELVPLATIRAHLSSRERR